MNQAPMNQAPLLLCVLLALSACKGEDPQIAARAAAAQAAAKEQAAEAVAKQFEDAVTAQKWELARGYGDMLQMEHKDSAAAQRVQPRLAQIKAKVDAEREARRVAALWSYDTELVGKGKEQLSAAIYSKESVDTGGADAQPVRLIFRDHPEWGTSSYLVLEGGDFNCYGGCKVQVTVDDNAPKAMAASRPDTDEAIAMFIEDEKALWRTAKGAKVLTIEFPVKAGGKRSAVFEVGGLDSAKLSKW